MAEVNLQGLRILVVEDEYLIADDLRDTLLDAAAVVLGPVPTVEAAKTVIQKEPVIDAALLDINLGDRDAYPIAAELLRRQVPFIFATGCEPWVIPAAFQVVPRLEKPLTSRALLDAVTRLGL